MSCCVLCRLSISASLTHGRRGGATPSVAQPDLAEASLAGASPAATLLPMFALLVLVWGVGDEGTCIAAAEQAKALLPFV